MTAAVPLPAPLLAPAHSSVLGARVQDGGTRFGLWAPRAIRVELVLVAEDRSQTRHVMAWGSDGVWTTSVPGVGAEQRYGYRVHGDGTPEAGVRLNPDKLLVDPYARAITDAVHHRAGSSDAIPLSVVVADSPPAEPLAEGETDDPRVRALRLRQSENLMATLILAAGVPMLTAGDELGRTQQGNNNAYCQDSPISWVDWDTTGAWIELSQLTQTLLTIRREHPVFQRADFRHGEPILGPTGAPTGRKNLAWFGGRTAEMSSEDWADRARRTLGLYLADDDEDRDIDEAYLVWIHGGADDVQVDLPDGAWASTYTVVAHSGAPGELPREKVEAGSSLRLPARTVVVLQVD